MHRRTAVALSRHSFATLPVSQLRTSVSVRYYWRNFNNQKAISYAAKPKTSCDPTDIKHRQYVMLLYRKSIKLCNDAFGYGTESYAPFAEIVREEFRTNMNEVSPEIIAKQVLFCEEQLERYHLPDPYKYPPREGGVLYQRNERPTAETIPEYVPFVD